MVARSAGGREVAGSNPVTPIAGPLVSEDSKGLLFCFSIRLAGRPAGLFAYFSGTDLHYNRNVDILQEIWQVYKAAGCQLLPFTPTPTKVAERERGDVVTGPSRSGPLANL